MSKGEDFSDLFPSKENSGCTCYPKEDFVFIFTKPRLVTAISPSEWSIWTFLSRRVIISITAFVGTGEAMLFFPQKVGKKLR